jgi:hypothetical protein
VNVGVTVAVGVIVGVAVGLGLEVGVGVEVWGEMIGLVGAALLWAKAARFEEAAKYASGMIEIRRAAVVAFRAETLVAEALRCRA